MRNKIRLPQDAWYGDSELELDLPPRWDVTICNMKGHDRARLGDKDIRRAFASPAGTPPLKELARGKKEVVIIFDDLARPTRVAELVPYVLEELKEADIPDKNIRFIAALGAHRAMSLIEFVKKLGAEVVERFPVYNHNPYENCTFLGKTGRRTPVSLNSEAVACDLKISIGGIVPHVGAGFGGGAKNVVPGIAAMETIWANHCAVGGMAPPSEADALLKTHSTVGTAKTEGNIMRLDMEEAARMLGLDFIVNAVMNLKRETVGLFAGDVVTAHAEGVKLAREVCATERVSGMDIVISNAYGKGNEAFIAIPPAVELLREEGGDLMLIANSPEGQVTHYLMGAFGRYTGGRLWLRRESLPPRVRRLFILSSHVDRAATSWFGPDESVIWVKTWAEVVEHLVKSHPDGAKVAVIPDGTVQYFI